MSQYTNGTIKRTSTTPPKVEETTSSTSEFANFDALKALCINNAAYFEKDVSENGQRLYLSFLAIQDALEKIKPKILHIKSRCKEFDFDENTPANGYRSFLIIIDAAVKHSIQINEKICLKRESTFSRKAYLSKEAESCAQLIASLQTCLNHLETLLSWSSDGKLFPDEKHSPQDVLEQSGNINRFCFYGRCLGFQFCDSINNILQFISMAMAVFSEFYYNRGSFVTKATSSVISSSKYLHDPEKRARRFVNISENADIDFCKAFWFLSENELICNIPGASSPRINVLKYIHLPPEPLTINVNGKEIDIPIPSSHIGNYPIQIRLISHHVHEGMIGEGSTKNKAPPARGLLIYCHGGGFVAQSSLSHECYLRDWAKELKLPIFSIDYSLAPEAPFPRALEEVTYAYCWALKNHHLLGSTGERIVMAGDSAGANLILTTMVKCIHLGVPLPHGIFAAYVPAFVNFMPSPSRIMCMLDPLLPFGFMMRCLKSYACPDITKIRQQQKKEENDNNDSSDTESFEEISESDLQELQAHKSPVSETSDTITNGSFVSSNDDDNTDALDQYILDSEIDSNGEKVAIIVKQQREQDENNTTTSSQIYDYLLQTTLLSFISKLKSSLGVWMNEKTDFYQQTHAEKYLDIERESNLLDEFKFVIPNNPYLSPYYATDEELKKFPPVRLLSTHMDPFLDDCITFAKRLKCLGNDVQLKVLDGLPHGFLNFALLSKDANEGSKVCLGFVKKLLDLDNLSN